MQYEVDRFQDTKRVLHDYYRGMEGKVPLETNTEFTRIALMDLIQGDEEGKIKTYDQNCNIAVNTRYACIYMVN